MEAGLTGEARHQADAARAEGVNQRRLWLLIAELDEKERGDTEEGRASQRDALRRVRSPIRIRRGNVHTATRSFQCGRPNAPPARALGRCGGTLARRPRSSRSRSWRELESFVHG